MNPGPSRAARRRFLIAGAGALASPLLLPRRGWAQTTADNPIAPLDQLDPLVWAVTKGAPIRKGRVDLELPPLADNGNSVPLKVTVDSPMTAAEHVRGIYLFSERNPIRNMASFYLGPRSGRPEVASRVRLAGSQTVVAIAQLSDGSFWSGSARVQVTLSACLDES
jgi:sulfur-oxidizing protein SoxY